jgi:hypothetical protein
VLGVVAMGTSVMFVRWADIAPCASACWRVLLALRRGGQFEVGP